MLWSSASYGRGMIRLAQSIEDWALPASILHGLCGLRSESIVPGLHPLDPGTQRLELGLDPFVSPVDLVDVVDDALSLGAHRRQQ